jgi:hypothetical protein
MADRHRRSGGRRRQCRVSRHESGVNVRCAVTFADGDVQLESGWRRARPGRGRRRCRKTGDPRADPPPAKMSAPSGFRTPDPLITHQRVRPTPEASYTRVKALLARRFGCRRLPVATRRFRLVGCHLRCKNVPSTESSAANLLITDATEAASNTHRCSRWTSPMHRGDPQNPSRGSRGAPSPRCPSPHSSNDGAMDYLTDASAARPAHTLACAQERLCAVTQKGRSASASERSSTPRHSASQRNPNRFIRRTTLRGPIRA